MQSSIRRQRSIYVAVLAGCLGIGMLLEHSPPAERIDNIFYDWMLARQPQPNTPAQSVVVAIDEATLGQQGGMREIRSILAAAIERISAAQPAAIADDILLADDNQDEKGNAALESALGAATNLILPCDLITVNRSVKWEDPLPRFARHAAALGHVYRDVSGDNGVNREVPLEEIAAGQHRWAMALAAYGAAHGNPIPLETPEDLQVGSVTIPAPRGPAGRPMKIRYLRSGIPRVSALEIDRHRDALRGKAVFVGVTALAANDRAMTPLGEISGVELHAHIYETIARHRFLLPARNDVEFLLCLAIAAAAGVILALRSGWQAYFLGGVILALAAWMPIEFFRHDIVFPFFEAASVAVLSVASAASFQYFFVQRALTRSESEKSRYQQAIHWAAHEMRTPLTAIQGSSEIMTRYALPEDKRLQLSEMINSESKRLARLIQTFLDVERLAEGQMELKREPFDAAALVATCLTRVAPIAERKKIQIHLDTEVEGVLTGDRELMEYAVYNLLTNAVKYSPEKTEIHVTSDLHGDELRLSIRDQGIGMDPRELKQIFRKFYRTKKAEASGEAGTGIGLSIVQQIVATHGGRMEVTSQPGLGSCFTMIVTGHAKASDRRG